MSVFNAKEYYHQLSSGQVILAETKCLRDVMKVENVTDVLLMIEALYLGSAIKPNRIK